MSRFKVGLGVSGGIAAYKAVEVMRLLQKAGCDVSVAMTKHATEFVQPLTFKALTDKYVIVDDYDPQNPDPIAHINFSQNIDLLLVVPATANIIAKFANGVADDFLSSTYLASTAPVLIAPAMNTTMWENPATRRNVERLRSDGVQFVEPIAGELACKTIGTGKLEDVENIADQALRLLTAATQSSGESEPGAVATGSPDKDGSRAVTTKQHETARNKKQDENPQPSISDAQSNDLMGERFLITAGGTLEAIDPVRFISNRSSGKMGFSIAEAAAARGADVVVVFGVTKVEPPSGVRSIKALSAREMHAAVMKEVGNATVFVGTAAVADFRPSSVSTSKIKKEARANLSLELVQNPDILADVSQKRSAGLLIVGFAAETEAVLENAVKKLNSKNLDMIVANDVTQDGAGFDSDQNAAFIFVKGAKSPIALNLMPKRKMADKILDEIVNLRNGSK